MARILAKAEAPAGAKTGAKIGAKTGAKIGAKTGTKAAAQEGGSASGHWLVKSEPDSFSWDQQVENGIEPWTGVRSHQAKTNLKAMQVGDRVFFYHSNIGKEIVGIVEVVRAAYPDPTADSGDWVCVDMKAVRPFKRAVSLAEMKADAALDGFALLRLSRLSVVPVSEEHWGYICGLGGVG